MEKEQSWETCKYGFPTDGGDEMAYELRRHGLYESYICGNKEILKFGIYPTKHIKWDDSSIEMVMLHGILIGSELSEEDVKRLETKVERTLAGCRHCKFYEPKKSKEEKLSL